MTTVVLRPDQQLMPVGTTMGAYPRSRWGIALEGAPLGSAVESHAIASDGTLTYTALTDGVEYVAYGVVSTVKRYLRFMSAPLTLERPVFVGGYADGEIPIWSDADQRFEPGAGGGSGGIPATLIDAKGDLIAGSAADTAAKLTAGANNQVLVAASGQTAGLQWVDQLPTNLVLPLAFPSFPTGTAASAANFRIYFMRFVMPRAGTLAGIALWVGTSSGNYDLGVYDTGDASAGNRTRLFSTGSTAVPAGNGWREMATPALAVTRGQHLDVMFTVDNTTATFGRQAPGASGMSTLPASFAVAAGGATTKLLGTAGTPGSLGLTTPIAEATLADPGTGAIPQPVLRLT